MVCAFLQGADATAEHKVARESSAEDTNNAALLADDTADSAEKQAQSIQGHHHKRSKLDAASLTPLPAQRQDTDADTMSSGQSAATQDAECTDEQVVQPTKLFTDEQTAAASRQVSCT